MMSHTEGFIHTTTGGTTAARLIQSPSPSWPIDPSPPGPILIDTSSYEYGYPGVYAHYDYTEPLAPTTTPAHPRMRTAQACEKCRIRKAKCSGEHPSCQRCISRGLLCEYSNSGRVRGVGKATTTSTATATGRERSGETSPVSLSPTTPTSPSLSSSSSSPVYGYYEGVQAAIADQLKYSYSIQSYVFLLAFFWFVFVTDLEFFLQASIHPIHFSTHKSCIGLSTTAATAATTAAAAVVVAACAS